MARSIIHVDMDAFFASVELASRPELRGLPVVVASASARGVVVAATYEARAYGIRAGQPTSQARRRAPGAVFIAPHHEAYRAVSRGVMMLLRDVTPMVEQVSVDEAFLDVTGAARRLGPAVQIAQEIRARIWDNFSITASAGVAASKSVAKIASTRAKPNGLLEVPPEATVDFLRPLPVGALWGIGPATTSVLERLGLRTVADLADSPDEVIARAIGQAAALHLLALARGQDDSPVSPPRQEKSISAETTFEQDLAAGSAALRRAVIALADKTAWRLREAGLMCRTIGVKLRRADFQTHGRSHTLEVPADSTKLISQVAQGLIGSIPGDGGVRLAGVRLGSLVPRSGAPLQLAFGEEGSGLEAVDQVRDDVRRRFGPDALRPGTLLPPGRPPERPPDGLA
ncbi:MAG: DNA polymerase IV [Bifidobacteriaceae bacterium]|jgi:DNA polymerase-4|nr:DNA polymerase IV [Bifidobacteriaceae bacterium]